MLSMKTLRVAIVTMGSALLLGPGMAAAATTDLNSYPRAPASTIFAAETLSDERTTNHGTSRAKYFNLDGPEDMDVVFRPRLNLDAGDDYHIRIELDGMIFRGDGASMETGEGTTTDGVYEAPGSFSALAGTPVVRSGANGSVAVIELTSAVTLQTQLMIELSDVLAVDSLSPGNYDITVTLHRDQFDAIDGIGAVASTTVGGTATLVRVVNSIAAVIDDGTPAVSSVDVDYLWFAKTAAEGGGPTSQRTLGTATVMARNIGSTVYDARDGEEILLANPDATTLTGIVAAGGVIINIVGDTSIGAFDIFPATVTSTNAQNEEVTVDGTCDLDPTGATAGSPVEGIESNDPPLTNTAAGLMAGQMYALCVEVDVEGPMTNSNPIENQEYTANVLIAPGATDLVYGRVESHLLGSGVIGEIRRDGTHKRVTYLTASEKYNQRLIIVNHSGKMVRYDLVGITTEDGTSVELSSAAMAAKEAGLNTIMPRSQVVLRIGDILEFDGMNRAAATVTVNSNPGNISVATTQVNLEDGSTDTVIY